MTQLELLLKIHFSTTKQVSTFVGKPKLEIAQPLIEKDWLKEEKVEHKIKSVNYKKYSYRYTLTKKGKETVESNLLSSLKKEFEKILVNQ